MKNSMKVMGATNLTEKERSEHDYYGTNPVSTEALLKVEEFNSKVWEPCAGHHLIANKLLEHGYHVRTSDLFEYDGYTHEILDFLNYNGTWDGDIITNPPYNLATECAKKALEVIEPGHKVAMLLRLQYLEGVKRYETLLKDNPPKIVYIFVNRQTCSQDDDFSVGSAVAYCWFIFEKGFTGDPIIKWLRTDK